MDWNRKKGEWRRRW